MNHIQQLVRTVEHGNSNDIWEAAKELSALATDLASSLMSLLADADGKVTRAAAAYVLGFARFASARDALEDALDNRDEDVNVRGHAAEALAYIHNVESVGVLVRNLEDPDPGVKYWCTFALGQIGSAKALSSLRHVAEHAGEQMFEKYSLRAEALQAIDMINERLEAEPSKRERE